ncbi:MAG: tRNA(Ile)-lysidine synthase [Chloroflexota bacterium]
MTTDPYPRIRATGAFERQVARGLGDLPADTLVVVACSGGPDSTAALIAVTRRLGPSRVVAACFDHRLRRPTEVARERAVVEAVARDLGVRAVLGRAGRKPADGSEAAARESRYRWLARICVDVGAEACVTGHTRDDQAETVLLRLARGSGADGLTGMSSDAPWPVRTPRSSSLRVRRPLLGIGRAEVEAYLGALRVEAARDPSNETVEYARNRVRHEVMPALRLVNARAVEHLVAFAERQAEDEAVIAGLAEAWLAAHTLASEPDGIGLDRLALRRLPAAVTARVVRLTATRLGLTLDAVHVRAARRAAEESSGTADLPLARIESVGKILWLRERPPTSGRTGNGPRR